MYSKFPFPISMENLPRHKQVFCLSLKFGCVLTALISIMWALLGLAGSMVSFGLVYHPDEFQVDRSPLVVSVLVATTLNHVVTFVLSALLLIGTLKKSLQLMRPWVVWASLQVMASLMIFVLLVAAHGARGDDSLLAYLIHFLLLMIRVYMLILVSSFYRQAEEEQDETQRLQQLLGKDTWYSTTTEHA